MTSEKLEVVKIGGKVCEDLNQLKELLKRFSEIPGAKVLIHGGGELATDLAQRLKLPVNYVEGRRVTTAEDLKIVTMVYAGWINKNITATMTALGQGSIGLCGTDNNLIQARRRAKATTDYGFVGDIEGINSYFLFDILSRNLIPIIAPITCSSEGQLLNTNADTVAAAIASAMTEYFDEVRLTLCLNTPGVLADPNRPESVISQLNAEQYEQLKGDGAINNGMLPKLTAGFQALTHGVEKVRICNFSDLHSTGSVGTHLC